MTAGSQRAALDAIHSARPIIARLSMARDSEDLAADLIEAWTATETGLRSLVGGSALTGRCSSASCASGISCRSSRRTRWRSSTRRASGPRAWTTSRPRADVNASRDAFLKLEAGLMGEPSAGPARVEHGPASARRGERAGGVSRGGGSGARRGGRVHARRPARPERARAIRGNADARCRRSARGRAGSRRCSGSCASRGGRDRGVRADGPAAAAARSPTASRRIAKGGARPRQGSS